MMSLWKFVIDRETEMAPGVYVNGCLALAIAESEDAARGHLRRYAAGNGIDSRWLEVARVIQLPIADGTVGGWAIV